MKKEGRKHNYDIYKKDNPSVIPKQVVNVVDLGYFELKRTFQNNYYLYYRIKGKEADFYQMMKRNTIKFIPRRG
ncbi:MAG TPA: hypothetical protein VN704_01975 [Verrucomicrobiae bacterium]|nr:hypothetical protein [Verrucomicrobiae bacterium]